MARITHITLTPEVIETIVLDEDYDDVEVMNRSTVGEVFFRVDGINPEVEGDDNYVAVAGGFIQVSVPRSPGVTVVKLVSIVEATISITGVV